MEKENNIENNKQEVQQEDPVNIEAQTMVKEKSSISKKIFSIALIVVCAIIVVGVTLGSFLPKSFNPGLNDPTYIVLHSSTNSSAEGLAFEKAKDKQYEEILSLYKQSFETTFFGALFQGKAFDGVVEQEGYKSLNSLSGTYLEFNYSESQVIRINGKTLEEAGITPMVSDTNYRSVIIEVVNSESLAQINVYFKYNASGTSNYSYIRFLTFAKQTSLYEYIENI